MRSWSCKIYTFILFTPPKAKGVMQLSCFLEGGVRVVVELPNLYIYSFMRLLMVLVYKGQIATTVRRQSIKATVQQGFQISYF